MFKRSKRHVILHIVLRFEGYKEFHKEDDRYIISRELHHQNFNKHMENIRFRDYSFLEAIVKSMQSPLDLVKGVENVK